MSDNSYDRSVKTGMRNTVSVHTWDKKDGQRTGFWGVRTNIFGVNIDQWSDMLDDKLEGVVCIGAKQQDYVEQFSMGA